MFFRQSTIAYYFWSLSMGLLVFWNLHWYFETIVFFNWYFETIVFFNWYFETTIFFNWYFEKALLVFWYHLLAFCSLNGISCIGTLIRSCQFVLIHCSQLKGGPQKFQNHPRLQGGYTGHEKTLSRFLFFWPFLAKTKQDWELLGHIHC